MTSLQKQTLKTRIPNLIVASAILGIILIQVVFPLFLPPEAIHHQNYPLYQRVACGIVAIVLLGVMHKLAASFLEVIWPERNQL